MTIRLETDDIQSFEIEYEKIAQEVVNASLDYVKCPYECEINIVLTDNEGICQLNQSMRNIDSPTDVLSFPAMNFSKPGDFSFADHDITLFNGSTGELMLGDIMISVDKVYEQAQTYQHSLKREFAFLIAHSMLHLSGYDHIEEQERLVMEQMQDDILKQIGYTRDILD